MKIENQLDTKDSVTPDLLSGKEASTSNGPAGSLQVEEKRRRAWEQWSADDIAAFFEGLNEFGKDFDAIQNCLYTKNRKKSLVNSTNIKNKDQVRHFYYRTWHKISKYLLPTPDEGKRMHKELYGLINYGEMWKKLGGYFNDRCGEKLNELVQHGVTSVKIKGKSYRIKTPVCPALKRLQSTGTETQKLPSTPERIVIELTPCCNADFLRVQSVAHNPRIRISTDSSSPLSTIISFLTKKWKPRSILEAESVAEDELIMRVTPEMKQVAPIGSTKKGRKRTFSGQEQMDETEVKLEVKSWILETSDQVTVGEVYTICGSSNGRLQLNYAWERRSKPEHDADRSTRDVVSLLGALVNIAKSSLMKSQPSGEVFPVKKAARRQVIASQPSDGSSSELAGGGINASRSPQSEASPTQNLPIESPIQFSRMRQRLRRPLRYGTSLKRGSLAATLSKMPGPSPIQARPHPSSLMAQSTTVNITWPPEENGNGTGSFVLQVQLDGQQQQTSPQKDIPTASVSGPLYLSPKKGPDIQNGTELDHDFFRPPSILLHTPVKAGGSTAGWATASTASSLPSTPNRLQEWMSILMPNTPEKPGAESSSVRSIPFSIPDSLSSFFGENGTFPSLASSLHSGEGSTWQNRDGDEISLSSLLNQLVSPAKSTASSRYTDLKLPFDLQSLVADNSVDLTAKFAELAASIAAADANTSKNRP